MRGPNLFSRNGALTIGACHSDYRRTYAAQTTARAARTRGGSDPTAPVTHGASKGASRLFFTVFLTSSCATGRAGLGAGQSLGETTDAVWQCNLSAFCP